MYGVIFIFTFLLVNFPQIYEKTSPTCFFQPQHWVLVKGHVSFGIPSHVTQITSHKFAKLIADTSFFTVQLLVPCPWDELSHANTMPLSECMGPPVYLRIHRPVKQYIRPNYIGFIGLREMRSNSLFLVLKKTGHILLVPPPNFV